ncbi:MAG: DUF4097 family beta strand repeat protein [Catenulisporales bacterium]|nr:DUF4097 family beta strand repeat protein [Catenulisporales bacterium]
MTYDAPPPGRPIGALKISTVALLGVVVAVGVPTAAAAIAMSVSGRVDDQRAAVAITATGPISRVVVQDSESDVVVTGDPAATGAEGRAQIQWKGEHGRRAALRQSVENGVLTLAKDCSSGGCGPVNIDLRVPANVSVQVTTSDGSVEVANVTGAVDLTSSDGELRASGLGSGDASFQTTNGTVSAEFTGAPARIRAGTTNADVHITTDGKTTYYDSVQTTNGSQSLTNPQDRFAADEIDVTTSNGNVSVK